jgi:hypothetical protein
MSVIKVHPDPTMRKHRNSFQVPKITVLDVLQNEFTSNVDVYSICTLDGLLNPIYSDGKKLDDFNIFNSNITYKHTEGVQFNTQAKFACMLIAASTNAPVVYTQVISNTDKFILKMLSKYTHFLEGDTFKHIYRPFVDSSLPLNEIKQYSAIDASFFKQYCDDNIKSVMMHTTRENLIEYGYTPHQAYTKLMLLHTGPRQIIQKGTVINNTVLWDGFDQPVAFDFKKDALFHIKHCLQLKSTHLDAFHKELMEKNTINMDLLPENFGKEKKITIEVPSKSFRQLASYYFGTMEMAKRYGDDVTQIQDILKNYINNY